MAKTIDIKEDDAALCGGRTVTFFVPRRTFSHEKSDLGPAFVFFMKREMPPLVQKILLGFILMMVQDVVLG